MSKEKIKHSISIVNSEVNTEFYTSLFEWLKKNNCYIRITTEYKEGVKENNMVVLGVDFFEFLKTIDFLTK